jgi:hypothetical protein
MKYKINLIGNSFTHLTGGNKGYSVHGKESKYIEWVFDLSSGETVYIDGNINQAFTDGLDGIKYGWLLESKFVVPGIAEEISKNVEKYFKVFKYIFTHNKELLSLDDRFKWCPAQGFWIKHPKIYEKTKMISMISSNKAFTEGQKTRLNWLERFGDQVDVYGRGINPIDNKEDGLCDYMFSVVIENGVYESYYTEKILDCFATGTIPVYLGSPDIGEHFNKDGIIELSEEFNVSEEIYQSKLDAIAENLKKVKELEVLEDFIYINYLK